MTLMWAPTFVMPASFELTELYLSTHEDMMATLLITKSALSLWQYCFLLLLTKIFSLHHDRGHISLSSVMSPGH